MSTPRTFVWHGSLPWYTASRSHPTSCSQTHSISICQSRLTDGNSHPKERFFASLSLCRKLCLFLTELQNPLSPWATGQHLWLVFQSSCFASRPEHRLSWHNFCGLPESVQELPGQYLRYGHNRFLPHYFQFIVHWRHTVVTLPTRARRVIVRSGLSVLLRWINREEGKNRLILAGYVTTYQACARCGVKRKISLHILNFHSSVLIMCTLPRSVFAFPNLAGLIFF